MFVNIVHSPTNQSRVLSGHHIISKMRMKFLSTSFLCTNRTKNNLYHYWCTRFSVKSDFQRAFQAELNLEKASFGSSSVLTLNISKMFTYLSNIKTKL